MAHGSLRQGLSGSHPRTPVNCKNNTSLVLMMGGVSRDETRMRSTGRHEAKGFVAPERRSIVEQRFGLSVGVRVGES